MNRLYKSLLLLVGILVTGVSPIVADSGSGSSGNSDKTIVLKPRIPIGNRHKAPSMQQVSCTYSDGNLHFEFAIPEGECQLILSDLSTGETVAATFNSAVSEPVYVGYHSTGNLTVITSTGNSYFGVW